MFILPSEKTKLIYAHQKRSARPWSFCRKHSVSKIAKLLRSSREHTKKCSAQPTDTQKVCKTTKPLLSSTQENKVHSNEPKLEVPRNNKNPTRPFDTQIESKFQHVWTCWNNNKSQPVPLREKAHLPKRGRRTPSERVTKPHQLGFVIIETATKNWNLDEKRRNRVTTTVKKLMQKLPVLRMYKHSYTNRNC